MSLYPKNIKRCQHIKINGTQCGSPALRDSKCCYYHIRYHWDELEKLENKSDWRCVMTPTLEDANSIQVSLANVMERLIMQEIDHKTAALLLYALQIAAMNLKRTTLEPAQPTHVVIDRDSVANRPIGATAWSKEEGREYDEIVDEEAKDKDNDDDMVDGMTAQERRDLERWVHGTDNDNDNDNDNDADEPDDPDEPDFMDKPRPAEGILNPANALTAGEG